MRFRNGATHIGKKEDPRFQQKDWQMRISTLCFTCLIIATALGFVGCGGQAPVAPAPNEAKPVQASAKKAWQEEWNTSVAAAKKEGEVVIYGDGLSNVKRKVAAGFEQKYGIDVSILKLSAAEVAEKMSRESSAGISVVDVAVSGGSGLLGLLKPKDLIRPLDDIVILPEVLAPDNWIAKKFPWGDNEHFQILSGGMVNSGIWRNTDLVDKSEIREYRDLLNPKWKGKIIMQDPTVSGGGSIWFRLYYPILGDGYMKGLIAQEPVVLRDKRLLVEWLARGKYAILLFGSTETMFDFQKAGAPIESVETKEGEYVGTNAGSLGIAAKPPHPNATKVFVNWVLTKEGHTLWSEEMEFPSFRADVPPGQINPAGVPKAGRVYLSDTPETMARGVEYLELSKQIFAPILGK